MKPALPYVPGSDGAGEVVGVGSAVHGFAPGDRVYFFGTRDGAASGAANGATTQSAAATARVTVTAAS